MSLGREEGQTPAGPHNCSGAAFVYFEAQTLVKDAAREPGRRFPSENEARLSRVSRASIVFSLARLQLPAVESMPPFSRRNEKTSLPVLMFRLVDNGHFVFYGR